MWSCVLMHTKLLKKKKEINAGIKEKRGLSGKVDVRFGQWFPIWSFHFLHLCQFSCGKSGETCQNSASLVVRLAFFCCCCCCPQQRKRLCLYRFSENVRMLKKMKIYSLMKVITVLCSWTYLRITRWTYLLIVK